MPHKKLLCLFTVFISGILFSNCSKDDDASSAKTEDTVVFADREGNIYAIDPVTGKQQYGSRAGRTFASPVVFDNTIYIGTITGDLHAIDIRSGDPKPHFPIHVSNQEIRSMPIIYNGAVYFGCDDNKIYAFDIASGTLKQGFPVTTGGWVDSSPTISNGVLYVGSQDAKLYAIDVSTGAIKTGFPVTTGGAIFSSPVVKEGVVYAGSWDNKIYAFDSNTGSSRTGFPVTTGGMIYSSPTINKGVLYVGSTDGKLNAINVSTGSIKPGFPVSLGTGRWIESSPIVSGDVVFIGTVNNSYPYNSELFAVDAATGNLKTGFPVTIPVGIYGGPVVYNGTVYVGSDDHKLYAVDVNTGAQKWSFEAFDRIYSSPCLQLSNKTTIHSSQSGFTQ